MPFQPVPGVMQIRHRGTLTGGGDIVNVIHAIVPNVTQPSTAEIDLLALQANSAWRVHILPRLGQTYIGGETTVTDLTVPAGYSRVEAMGLGGGDSGTPMSVQTCALIRFLTAGGGVPRKGRLFLSPLSFDRFGQNVINDAAKTNLVTAFNAYRQQLVDNGFEQVVVSRYSNGAARPEGVFKLVTGVEVRSLVASQRDRRPGEGT